MAVELKLLVYMLLRFVTQFRPADDFQSRCLSFSPQNYVQNSTLQVLQYVPASKQLSFPYNDPTCNRPNQLVSVDTCRVGLSIATSSSSSIVFELWLPETWNGRVIGTGNGGLDGCIKYEELAYTSQYGFAAFGSNNGHNGTTGVPFYKHPEVIRDFSWRSLHTSTIAGKMLTRLFYERPHEKSYYLGCSLGGRQGVQTAKFFPDDFDGILIGAPAVDFNNLYSWRASFFPILGDASSPDFITPSTWKHLIHNEILSQCDGIDGVIDGIIEDPSLCNFRPEVLTCINGTHEKCLTPVQVGMVQHVFNPLYGEDAELIYPRMQPGSEEFAVRGLYAGHSFAFSRDWFRYVIYKDPSWNASSFTVHDAAVAEALNPANIKTWPSLSDLSEFRNRSGKILAYHGGQDNQITSFDTERFYNHLSPLHTTSTDNNQNFSEIQNFHPGPLLDDFFRFFRISGMFHCDSGPGAWVLGQSGGDAAAGLPFDRENNILAALVDWVENGLAPETVMGTKFVNDSAADGISFQRMHCRYPLRNTYIGGDYRLPSSWKCLEPYHRS